MQKFRIAILLILCTFCIYSQDYTYIDDKVKVYPNFSNINNLSIRIRNDFEKESERTRAAFIWVAHNITYFKSLDDTFNSSPRFVHYSESGRQYNINKYRTNRVKKAFKKREGICEDYSLILHELLVKMGLESKIIHGVSKTVITEIKKKPVLKNHSWNAVKIDEQWKLLDPTWASYYLKNISTKKYIKICYLTPPEDFVKTHYPSQNHWQLLEKPIDLDTFFSAPLFFPNYFDSQLKLSKNTKGTLSVSNTNQIFLKFDKIQSDIDAYYFIESKKQIRKIKFIKKNNGYVAKLKFNETQDQYLTIWEKNGAILRFKIKRESS